MDIYLNQNNDNYNNFLKYNITMMIRKIFRNFCNDNKINKQVVSQIIKTSEEVAMSQEQMQQQVQVRLKQLQNLHRKTQQLIDSKIKFPIKLCGTSDKYEKKFSYLPHRVMSYYSIPTSRVTDYLLKMYKASLYAIADRNTQYMKQYWQQGFMNKALKSIDQAKSKTLKMKVQQDSNYLQEIPQSCQVIDSIMIRGLSMNRNQNLDPSQYIRFSQIDEYSLITYTPKQITENNQNFIDPNKNKTVYQGYDKMLLRVLVRIKSPLRLIMPEFKVPSDLYTWEHLCIMQNQMVPMKPLESDYKLETLVEWLGKYRFGPWRVADIDNFMLGNSPFRNHHPEQEEIDPIFKNTKLDKSYHIDIRMI